MRLTYQQVEAIVRTMSEQSASAVSIERKLTWDGPHTRFDAVGDVTCSVPDGDRGAPPFVVAADGRVRR